MSEKSLWNALSHNFLGHSPTWYKRSILGLLLLNPLVLWLFGPFVTGWLITLEFIFTLAMALKCYPLQPGGLLALQAVLLGLTTPGAVFAETTSNVSVILLLMFMVAGVYYLKDLLFLVFSRLFLGVTSKPLLSFLFAALAACLSAFLDALTVTAVLITVAVGFYNVYHSAASALGQDDDPENDIRKADLEQFRRFMQGLLMHGAVGTALGGVCTLVGEPQNLLIGTVAGWDFQTFFLKVAPVSLPVLVAGLTTTVLLEKFKVFGYGTQMPTRIYEILQNVQTSQRHQRNSGTTIALIVQAIVAAGIVVALAFHWAEPGIIGLTAVVLLTAFNGIVEEHQIGKAFTESLPFLSLLVVFFAIVAMIHDQHLFSPVIDRVLALPMDQQPGMLYIANGLLSMISDNVFVATIYISEVKAALDAGLITREHFETLAIAINAGTNLPSVATPNGQAAFLFLLTSAIAPLVRLTYGRMVWMALPYTIVMGTLGYILVVNAL
ncbi:MAG: sodium/proton antiporter NhaB [Oligoflexus sp.]|jgi:NhaB family Na+:H+ antiporter